MICSYCLVTSMITSNDTKNDQEQYYWKSLVVLSITRRKQIEKEYTLGLNHETVVGLC